MSLSKKWFDQMAEREAMRNERGVSLEKAARDLRLFRSTVYPVAYEMARWLLQHWTPEQQQQLPAAEYAILQEIAAQLAKKKRKRGRKGASLKSGLTGRPDNDDKDKEDK